MKRSTQLVAAVLAVMMLLPIRLAFAQTPGKKVLPQTPITYPGDTDETISRRAQWIDGAKKEGALDWWGILAPKPAMAVVAEFNKKYPFITVNYWRGQNAELATKFEAGFASGRASVDIILGGEPENYTRWRKMGMMEKFTDILPGIKSIDKRMYSKYKDWVQPGNNGITPAYNTKQVSAAEAPKSWEDLLDPKWKGQIVLPISSRLWTALALGEGGWGIEKTEEFLRKLRQQQIFWTSSYPTGHAQVVSGEFKVIGDAFVYHTLQAQEKMAPVDWCRVRPVAVTGPAVILQKTASHPNAARLFLEWLLSPQGLVTYDKITYNGVATPGSGTRLAKALAGLPLVYRTEEVAMKTVEMGLDKRFSTILGTER